MFIPLDRKPDWHNPPLMTILLIVVNILCFTLWQGDDDYYEQQAYDYYLDSDLPNIELPLYREFLAKQQSPDILWHQTNERTLLSNMLVDGQFQQQLKAGNIVTPAHPQYTLWQQQHQTFSRYLQRIVTYNYSFKTAEPSSLTLVTHMFLHADWGHLIGNMIFLLLIGFIVEMSLGRSIYLFTYLLAGICSGLFYLWLEPGSLRWSIGASGAIAGLMGVYTVIFGKRRIRFFFTLLFYFDYVRAPAIILLPIWLGYEVIYQIWFPSNVNNLAHIGGLLSGAAIGFLAKRFNKVDIDYLDKEEKEQTYKQQYQQGLAHLARMEVDKARRIFSELEQQYPERSEIIEQLFNLSKLNPGDPAIHDYALRLINLQGSRALTTRQLHDVFIDYMERVQPNARLSPDQLIMLALRFAAGGFIEDAERIVLYLTTRKSDFQRNAEGLMALATQYQRQNNPGKAQKYLNMLLECYPDSSEALHARQALEK